VVSSWQTLQIQTFHIITFRLIIIIDSSTSADKLGLVYKWVSDDWLTSSAKLL